MATGTLKPQRLIKTVNESYTTDQYGQVNIEHYQFGTFINAYADDYRYFCVKQNGSSIRVYNAATSGITVAANTTLNVNIVYQE